MSDDPEEEASYQFCLFDASVIALREIWCSCAFAPEHVWTRVGANRATDSSAFDVLDQRQLRGTAKPGCVLPLRHAAHEKIASDLAALLDWPIPPVTLYTMPGELPACPHKKKPGEPSVAISAWPFLSFEEWGNRINGKMSDSQKESRRAALSAMWVFESWISAHEDRGPKHTLVNSTLGAGPVGLAFIDFAFSMSKYWTTEDAAAPASKWWWQDIARDEAAARYAVEKLRNLNDRDIREVVTRIPEAWLPPATANIIIANLLSRKAKINQILGLEQESGK